MVTLVGPTPPPYGGISVHVFRLASLLHDQGFSVEILDMPWLGTQAKWRTLPGFAYELVRRRRGLVHIHGMDRFVVRLLLVAILRIRGTSHVVVSYHNPRSMQHALESNLKRRLLLWTVALVDKIHVVSDRINELGLLLGIPSHKLVVYPDYLPPLEQEQQSPVDRDTEAFLYQRAPMLLAMGRANEDFPRDDWYGIEVFLDAITMLREHYPSLGALMVVPDEPTTETVLGPWLGERISSLGIRECVRVIVSSRPLLPLLSRVDVYVRPTRTDGDSVSVRESLHVGAPVVASDAAERPVGCYVFPSGDPGLLAARILDAVNEGKANRLRAAGRERQVDSGQGNSTAIEMYKDLLSSEQW